LYQAVSKNAHQRVTERFPNLENVLQMRLQILQCIFQSNWKGSSNERICRPMQTLSGPKVHEFSSQKFANRLTNTAANLQRHLACDWLN